MRVKRSVRVSHLICVVSGEWLVARETENLAYSMARDGRLAASEEGNQEDLLRERQRNGRRLATPMDAGGALRLRRGQGRSEPLGARFIFFAPLLSLKS
jgi:hypothetical protein